MESMVIDITIQEVDNGFVVIARKSGQTVSFSAQPNELEVGKVIQSVVAQHKKVKES